MFFCRKVQLSEEYSLSEIENQIEKKVIQVLATLLHFNEKAIRPELLLVDDLGMDSFAAVEMLFQIEDQYGLEIPDEEMVNFKTVKDVVDYIYDILPEN